MNKRWPTDGRELFIPITPLRLDKIEIRDAYLVQHFFGMRSRDAEARAAFGDSSSRESDTDRCDTSFDELTGCCAANSDNRIISVRIQSTIYNADCRLTQFFQA